jgi:hypothetical protein
MDMPLFFYRCLNEHLLKISIFVRSVYIAFCIVKIYEEFEYRICSRNLRPCIFCARSFLRDDFGFIFALCIACTIVLFIYQSSHHLLHKDIPNTILQHCCLSLKIRGFCSWGNCEQDCTVIYRKHFSCFSTILVCTCVKISRWERRIIVIQCRTN